MASFVLSDGYSGAEAPVACRREETVTVVDMNNNPLADVLAFVNEAFPADGLKAALVLAIP